MSDALRLSLAEMLVNNGAKPDQYSFADVTTEVTPLYVAVTKNHPDVVTFFLARSQINPNLGLIRYNVAYDSDDFDEYDGFSEGLVYMKESPLYAAIEKNFHNMAELLIAHRRTDCGLGHKEYGNTVSDDDNDEDVPEHLIPLYVASSVGSVRLVKQLLDKGSKPNGADEEDVTPLHAAIVDTDFADDGISEHRFKVAKLLLLRGARPNARDSLERTPLHEAVEQGSLRMVRLLLICGAKPKLKDCYGDSPLSIARREGDARIIKALKGHIARGAAHNHKRHHMVQPEQPKSIKLVFFEKN